ncbi:alpha-2-macroglobulin [Hyphomonas sp.]|uniref:alpha-2-macroglobulin family protein n=1 Tax=Hyphomonas sp. TaxID=87 RepID=UPI0025BAC1B1|nr:alpha-2-macroglobulin [Hyphomonas sp.]MBI1398610.1 alpha-2-macroglobulin family protein [Hyphomonas sp.]
MSSLVRGRSWGLRALAAAAFLFVAACGGSQTAREPGEDADAQVLVERSPADEVAARKREEARQRARDAAETEFSYFRYRIDTSTEQPLACFVFSAALDPKTDYSPYVEFRPAFRAALSVEGRELCVGGLTFGTTRTATILAGLPAADGRTLKRAETVPVDFADRPPFVGFKGTGVILPRENADGLPIETVNVDKVRVVVSRINDRALVFKNINAGTTTGQGQWSWMWGPDSPEDVAEELFTGTMDVDNTANAPVVTVFPLQDVVGPMKPGAYFVSVTDAAEISENEGPPASSGRWILLTDLALTAYRGENGLDVTLRSLKDGKVVKGATIQLLAANNAVLAEAKPNDQGRVTFDAPLMNGQGNMTPRLVLATAANGELAALDLARAPVDLSDDAIGGRHTPGPVDAYVYTDRGIYRPGESVELTAMLRDRAGRQVSGRNGNLIIYRPNGLIASKTRFTDPKPGAVLSTFNLPKGASRGEWRASIEIDGVSMPAGEARFAVEDFVPQRIAVDITADETRPLKAGGVRDVEIASRFLYGAPGAGLTVKTEARVEADPAPFKAYKGFTYGRQDQSFEEQILEFDDTTTDGEGKALVRLSPGTAGSNSGLPLRLNTVVSVLEPGGRAVAESVRVPYRPEPLYVGIKPAFESSVEEGGDAKFEVVAINADGEAVAQRLSWKVLAIDFHYDWYRDGDQWTWRRSRTVTKVNEGVVNTPAGGVAEIKAPGLEWGSHELVIEGQGALANVGASTTFYVGWGGWTSEDGTEAPDRVKVIASETSPKAGQNAELTIVAPYDGQAQVVVATDRVLTVQNLAVSEKGTRITLPVTADWGEGAYVMVTVYSGRDPALRAKPRRAVGVAHVPVDMDSRTFNVSMTAPEVARPLTEQIVEVKIEGGPKEPVYLTLAAVDEGILQLTKFKSPDPVAYYFGRKALGVELHDDYGRLLDPNMGLPAEVRVGGDQLGGEGLTVVPTKSVVLFSGLVEVGRNGKAKIPLDLPEFNGELRLMAVAWSQTGLGSTDQKMKVRDRAPADLVMPRFLAPGDEAVITASIDNVELAAGQFIAKVAGGQQVSVAAAQMTRTLKQGQRADIPVSVAAKSEGISSLRLEVSGPDKYSVSRNYEIQTRSPYLPESRATTQLMRPGDSFNIGKDVLKGYVPGSVDVAVGFSPIPVDPGTLYASLDRYPYGCTEQLTSRALPLVYAEQLVTMGAKGSRDNARDKVQVALNTILNRQGADGAFGLWREGDGYATPWLGAYATDFVYRAKQAGYSVPDEALTRAYGALRSVASGDAWRVYGYDTDVYEGPYSTDTQRQMMYRSSAYALYVLAKAGQADISRLRYMHDRELDAIDSPLARAHIGAGLAYLGDRARAVSAFKSAESQLGYKNSGDYYQTPLRDLAGILALAAEAQLPETVERLATRLGKDVPDASSLTTQEKSYMLQAVNALTQGEDLLQVGVTGLGAGNDNQRQYMLSEAQAATGVSFKLNAKAPVFRTVLVTGAPASAPPAVSSKLKADKQFYTMSGAPVKLDQVRQGDKFVVGLTVSPDEKRLNPVIVADLLPAGFEIETVLRVADARIVEYDWYSGTDRVREGAFAFLGTITQAQTAQAQDDRFVAAVNVYDKPVTLAYVVRAVTPGTFAMPGVVAEDMYRPEVYGRSAPGRVTILAAQGTAGGK